MSEKKNPPPTRWEVPDDLWARIAALLNELDPPKGTGRPRADARRILDALIFRVRTGCQWNHIPRVYGDDATIHRTFQRWQRLGVFARIWAMLVEACAAARRGGLGMAGGRAMGKARLGGDAVGPNPTDRAKNGTRRSLLTDGGGGPLAVVVAPANRHDTKLLAQTLEAIVVERPEPSAAHPQHAWTRPMIIRPARRRWRRTATSATSAGSARRQWRRTKKASAAPLGSGADPGMVVQVSRYLGAL